MAKKKGKKAKATIGATVHNQPASAMSVDSSLSSSSSSAVPTTSVDPVTLNKDDENTIESLTLATDRPFAKVGSVFIETFKEKCSLFVGFHLLSLYEGQAPSSNKALILYLLYRVKDLESSLRPATASSKKLNHISSHTFLRLFLFIATSSEMPAAERLMAQLILTGRLQPLSGNLTPDDFVSSTHNITKQMPRLETELADIVAECEECMQLRQRRWSTVELGPSSGDDSTDSSNQVPLPNNNLFFTIVLEKCDTPNEETPSEKVDDEKKQQEEIMEMDASSSSTVEEETRRKLDLEVYLGSIEAGTSLSPLPTKTMVELIKASPLDSPLLAPLFDADPLLMSSIIQTNHKIASELIIKKVQANRLLIENYVNVFLTIEVCVHCIEILDRIYKEIEDVPVEPLQEYIRYCVVSCEQVPAQQQQKLNRLLRLVSLFLIALLKSNVIKPNMIASELNPFILKFTGHKDMTILYQALAEAQSREAKIKKT